MRIVTVAAAAVLAVLAGLLVVRAQADDRADAAVVRPTPVAVASTPPTLGVIGDSFAAGTVLGGADGQGFPRMIADRVGWRSVTTAVSGTGYVAHPPQTLPYEAGQVERMVAARPSVLVVEGSQNDGHSDPAAVGTAAASMFARLRRELPRTRIVVVGPVASNSGQAASLARVDAAVAAAARPGRAAVRGRPRRGLVHRCAGALHRLGPDPPDVGRARPHRGPARCRPRATGRPAAVADLSSRS